MATSDNGVLVTLSCVVLRSRVACSEGTDSDHLRSKVQRTTGLRHKGQQVQSTKDNRHAFENWQTLNLFNTVLRRGKKKNTTASTKEVFFFSFSGSLFCGIVTLYCKVMIACLIQTQKGFKITLFISTKHNLRIFGLIPFIKLQNDT